MASTTRAAGARSPSPAQRADPTDDGRCAVTAQLALCRPFLQGGGDLADGLSRGADAGVVQQHAVAGGGRDLRDAGTHGAAADDATV